MNRIAIEFENSITIIYKCQWFISQVLHNVQWIECLARCSIHFECWLHYAMLSCRTQIFNESLKSKNIDFWAEFNIFYVFGGKFDDFSLHFNVFWYFVIYSLEFDIHQLRDDPIWLISNKIKLTKRRIYRRRWISTVERHKSPLNERH